MKLISLNKYISLLILFLCFNQLNAEEEIDIWNKDKIKDNEVEKKIENNETNFKSKIDINSTFESNIEIENNISQNSQEAKTKLGHFKFDLIVLDVMMPGQSGYELTKEIKGNNCPPIILLTAKGEVENRIKGLELGADDYIGKPFEPKELLLRINNIISKKVKIDLQKKHSVGKAIIDLNKMIIELNNKQRKINVTEKKILI